MTGDLTRGQVRTPRGYTQRRPCKDGGRDWRGAAINQGVPRIAGATGSWKKQGRDMTADTLILDF